MSFPPSSPSWTPDHDYPAHLYVAYEQACKAGHAAYVSGYGGPYRFNDAFREVMYAHGTFNELMLTMHVARLVDRQFYLDVYDITNQDRSELFPPTLWVEFARHIDKPTLTFMIRVMPRWAIQTLLDFIDRTRAAGPPVTPWGHPHDHGVYISRLADMERTEPLLHYELAERHHNQGRTLYLQTQAARGVEQALVELAPGINPTPLQKLVAGFLSLSFGNIAPARPPPAAAASSNVPHKRKAEEDEDEEKDSSNRSNKQKL